MDLLERTTSPEHARHAWVRRDDAEPAGARPTDVGAASSARKTGFVLTGGSIRRETETPTPRRREMPHADKP